MTELVIQVRFTPNMFRAGLAGLLLSGLSTELASESFTLTTYYPAPSGVYARMITTDSAWLARDSGRVGIRTRDPQAVLDVAGTAALRGSAATTGLQVTEAGRVGVGTTSPDSELSVAGSASVSENLTVNGLLRVGWSAGTPADAQEGTVVYDADNSRFLGYFGDPPSWKELGGGGSGQAAAYDTSDTITVVSPGGNGWVMRDCPAGYVVTGLQVSMSDTWSMHCSKLVPR